MKEVAEELLKRRYRRKTDSKGEKIKEKPWMTEEIRKQIKQRKTFNRLMRNAKSDEEDC